MRILLACECSGRIRDAFASRGHFSVSADFQESETPAGVYVGGDAPEGAYHYQGDVFDIVNDGWDMMIAHPPCTHLAVSGAKHFAKKRADGRQQAAIDLFLRFTRTNIPHVAIENPVGIIGQFYIKPTQIVQPWMFGDSFQKTTCLWLWWLPPLVATNIVDKGEFVITSGGKKLQKWYSNNTSPKNRSRTFSGIAVAMADQWGDVV